MKIKEIPLSEFKELHEKFVGNLRITPPDIFPWDTEETRAEKWRLANNPPLPREIEYHDENGVTIYKVKRG